MPGRWDEADAGSPFSAQRNLSKCFRFCHPSPQQRRALGWHGAGTCYSCSRTAMSLSPAQFHLHSQCHLPTAPAFTDQSHPARAASSLQLQQQTRSHTHAAAGPWGSVRGAAGQAVPPGTKGEAGLRQAEDEGGRDGEGWEGALVFVTRTHLSLCSITLDHHLPRVCSSASWRCCHPSQVAWQPPRGGFCHRYK